MSSGGGILIFANVTEDRYFKMFSFPLSEICLSRHSVVLEVLGILRFCVAHRFTCWGT